jgi:hypothetical protein
MSWVSDLFKGAGQAVSSLGSLFGLGGVASSAGLTSQPWFWPVALGLGYYSYKNQKDAQKAQQDALQQMQAASMTGTQEYLDYLNRALEQEKLLTQQGMQQQEALTREGIDQQMQMFQKALGEEQAGRQAAMQVAMAEGASQLAAGLLSGQLGLDTQLALMRAAQEERRPYQMAQLGALQALPYLQTMLGLPAYKIPTTSKELAPETLGRNLTGEYQATIGQISPIIQGLMGISGTGQPSTGTASGAVPWGIRTTPILTAKDGQVTEVSPGRTLTSDSVPPAYFPLAGLPVNIPLPTGGTMQAQPGYESYSLEPAQVNISDFLSSSPIYQLQKRKGEEAINAALAARGLGRSSYAVKQLGDFNRELAAQETEKQLARLQSLVNLGMGGTALAGVTPSSYSGALGGITGGLGGLRTGDISSILNQAANARTNLYSGLGQSLQQVYSGLGAGLAGGYQGMANASGRYLSDIGNVLGQSGINQAALNYQSQLLRSQQPSWLDSLLNTGLTAYALGNIFKKGGIF